MMICMTSSQGGSYHTTTTHDDDKFNEPHWHTKGKKKAKNKRKDTEGCSNSRSS